MSTAIESVLNETRVFEPSPAFVAQAHLTKADYHHLVAEANKDYAGYWARLARDSLIWHKPFTQTLDESNAPFYRWFADGQLNASYNCLDRHMMTTPNRLAIIFEADDGTVSQVTYRDLYERVCQFANGLKKLGIKKGDRVLVYMPMSVEAVVAMQACARIGAIHSVVFGGFSAKSINERIIDAGARLVITSDGQFRGGKEIALKPAVDEALAMGGCQSIEGVVVYRRTGGQVAWDDKRDIWWHDLVTGLPHECDADPGRRRAPAVHPLHVGFHGQAEGRPAFDRRLPARRRVLAEVDLRHQGFRRLLVHRRRGLDHRPHLRRLRAAGGRRDAGHLRRRADVPVGVALLGDDPAAQGHDLLHGADGDPLADQARRRPAEAVRPVEPAAAGLGGRADQPRGVDVVLHARRRLALPDRRHLVADRDRQPHDLADAGRDAVEAGLVHVPAAGHPGGDRRRDRARRRVGEGRLPGHQAALAVDDPDDLGRPGPLQEVRTTPTTSAASSTSRATARTATSTATSGSWAGSTTC